MRTTIDLEYDTLIAAKEIARAENTSLGKVISRLLRQALTGGAAPKPSTTCPPRPQGSCPSGRAGSLSATN